jgi:hypothetical protein
MFWQTAYNQIFRIQQIIACIYFHACNPIRVVHTSAVARLTVLAERQKHEIRKFRRILVGNAAESQGNELYC